MKKRSFAGLLSGLLAVSALATPPIYAQDVAPAMAPGTLGFETMAAVSGPYVGAANPVRDIAGGGLPSIISSAQGELRADGALTVSVRGLVLARAEPVPGNLQGVNPAPMFHAHRGRGSQPNRRRGHLRDRVTASAVRRTDRVRFWRLRYRQLVRCNGGLITSRAKRNPDRSQRGMRQ